MAGHSGKATAGGRLFRNEAPASARPAWWPDPRPGLARSALSAVLAAAVLAGPGAGTAWAACIVGSTFSQELTLNWGSISPALVTGSNYTGSATIATANGNVVVGITLTNTGAWNGSNPRPSLQGGNLALGGTFNPSTETIVMGLTFRNFKNDLLPVQNVRFTVSDIDEWTAGGGVSYRDTATLSSGTWTTVGSNVAGLNTATATAIANDSGSGTCTGLSASATCQAAATIAPVSPVTGFTMTYKNFLASASNPYQEIAVSNVAFCVEPAMVPVTIASVDSLQDASGLAVEWTTTMEMANAGFNVYGAVGRDWRRLNDMLIPSQVVNSSEPQHYAAQFPGVATDRILLEDVDIRGRGKRHGPFEVGLPHGRETKAKRVDMAGIKRANAAHAHRAKIAVAFKAAPAALPAAPGTQSSARLAVTESGVQRITHAELAAANVDLGPDPSRIGLADGGRAVPRHVDDVNGNGVFDAGDAIEFVGYVQPTLYSNNNQYVLMSNGSNVAIAAATSRKNQGGVATTYRANYRAYPDNEYSASAPVGSIPWYDELLSSLWAPELTRSFDLPDVNASSSEQATLTIDLWGLSDFPGGADDHHVLAFLNGVQVADSRFGGLVLKQLTVNVATSALQRSGNVLKLTLALDTGQQFDFVALDGFRLDYPAFTQAKNGGWSGDVPSNRGLEIGAPGDCTGLHVWAQDDLSIPDGLKAYRATGLPAAVDGGRCRIVLPSQRTGATRYWLAQDGDLRKPAVAPGVPQALVRADKNTGYLIISHPLFVDALGGLVGLQQSRGLQTQVVTTEAIFAAHSDHQRDADAIHAFIKATATQRNGKLRYVVLVGGDGYDYFDILGREALSLVPTRYAKVGDLINFAPTDVSYGDIDGDGLPDLPVGRIIARTVGELDAVVAKLIGYQGGKSALLVTGKSDGAASLPAQHTAMSSPLPGGGWQVSDIAADNFGNVNDARAFLQSALGTGYPLISYLGHSDYDFWDFGPLFDRTDVAYMPSSAPAVVTQWACWNSYFVSVYIETLAHTLLLTEGKGAASVIGSSTLTDLAAHNELGRRFFAILAKGPIALGDALLRAQRQVGQRFPAMRDDILAMGLLGDPALVVGGP